ncbi:DUF3014 domain-containing protein [Colwelliaceae bacterium MEBiC 14330]
MEKSQVTKNISTPEDSAREKKYGPLIMFVAIFIVVVIAIWQFSGGKAETSIKEINEQVPNTINYPKTKVEAPEEEIIKDVETIIDVEPEIKPIVQTKAIVEQTSTVLPSLDESDPWVQEKLPELTWRNELLALIISEDMVRRFVVFTDNFSQGLLAYEHSPFTRPKTKFSVDEQRFVEGEKDVWQWDNNTSKRFDLYVDLLRSVDSSTLVKYYFEAKPLIDQAYSELGYEEDFTDTLQDAITQVLDFEFPKSSMALTRNSVMYKYQDPAIEGLNDSDKLLLRIGKENLLIIKSVLLEVNEKLTKKSAQ